MNFNAASFEIAQDGPLLNDWLAKVKRDKTPIIDFLVARYGDFVLYKPPLKPSNYLIWFGPFVLLLIAAFLLWRALRRQKTMPEHEITVLDALTYAGHRASQRRVAEAFGDRYRFVEGDIRDADLVRSLVIAVSVVGKG